MLPFNVFSKAYLLMKERLRYTEKTLNLTKALIADSHLLQSTAIAETYVRVCMPYSIVGWSGSCCAVTAGSSSAK